MPKISNGNDANERLQAWAMWDCIADDSLGKDVWHDPAFKIYRGLGNLVLLVYMWGVNIWVREREEGREIHPHRDRQTDWRTHRQAEERHSERQRQRRDKEVRLMGDRRERLELGAVCDSRV